MRNYRVISADSHVVEPPDLWLNYIDPKYKERAPRVVREPDTDIFHCEDVPLIQIGLVSTAGKTWSQRRAEGRFEIDIRKGAWDPHERIKDMEVDGVDGEVVYPSMAMRMFALQDSQFMHACFQAYNSWVADFCRPYPDRLKAIGMVNLDDVERGVQELHRIAKLGLAGGMIAIYGGQDQAYSDPKYDPFWAAAQDLDLPISLHVATERSRFIQSMTPKDASDRSEKAAGAAMRMMPKMFVADGPVSIQRSLQAIILFGVFKRFPKLKLVSAENELSWAIYFLERLDHVFLGRSGSMVDTTLKGDMLPSEYFHRNVHMTFIHDKSGVRCREMIGVDHIMWSSDFPHPSSTWPNSQRVIAGHFAGVPAEERQKMVAENAMRLYRFGRGG